jgi:Zn-dependent protease
VGILSDPAGAVLNLIVLLLSLTFHEFFHAWSAWKLGDDTAARMGRLTLNPIPHIDPFGTLLLPLVGAPIGWAKPVPVNPANFTRKLRMGTGDIIVSAAGPLSNILLGLIAAIASGLLARFAPASFEYGEAAGVFLQRLMIVNAGLAIFNLLPIPPLDGGHVAENLVPYRHRDAWARYAAVAPMILLGVIAADFMFGIPILRTVMGPPWGLIIDAYGLVTRGIAA